MMKKKQDPREASNPILRSIPLPRGAQLGLKFFIETARSLRSIVYWKKPGHFSLGLAMFPTHNGPFGGIGSCPKIRSAYCPAFVKEPKGRGGKKFFHI
jgi:hypothetical protein